MQRGIETNWLLYGRSILFLIMLLTGQDVKLPFSLTAKIPNKEELQGFTNKSLGFKNILPKTKHLLSLLIKFSISKTKPPFKIQMLSGFVVLKNNLPN